MTYVPANFEVATSNSLSGEAFTRRKKIFDLDLGVKVTRNVAQYPLNPVTYPGTKFEVTMDNKLGDALTRKFII